MHLLVTYITKLDVLEFIWICDAWNYINFHIIDAFYNDDIFKYQLLK